MTPWTLRLIIANVVVYFLERTMPGLTSQLAFMPALVVYRPWTVVTYMFLHGSLGHIFFNMLALYFFGPRVEMRLGARRYLWLYFLSGISGAVLSFIAVLMALMPSFTAIIGASGAVFGVLVAFAYYWPRDQIYIWGVLPIEARWLVIITVAISLWFGITGGGGGIAHFAHLGGIGGAFLYLKWIQRMQGASARRFQRAAQPKIEDRRLANWRRVDPQAAHEVNRDELNRILDKINSRGLASLTPDERRFLASFVPPDDRIPPPT